MARSLDFTQALKLPYEKENLIPVVVIPGAIWCVFGIVTAIASFPGVMLAGVIAMLVTMISPLLGGFSILIASLLLIIVPMLFITPVYGYLWEFISVLREEGYDAAPPEWEGNWKEYTINGLKVLAYIVALNIAVSIILIVFAIPFAFLGDIGELLFTILFFPFWILVLLGMPYYVAGLMHSSDTKELGDLFDIPKAIEVGTQCYVSALIAMVAVCVIGIGYLFGMIFASLTLIGPAFVGAAFHATVAHLVTQAYDDTTSRPARILTQEVIPGAATQQPPQAPPPQTPPQQPPPQAPPQQGPPPQQRPPQQPPPQAPPQQGPPPQQRPPQQPPPQAPPQQGPPPPQGPPPQGPPPNNPPGGHS